MQHQLSDGMLLDDQGRLCEAGYATRLCKRYDRSHIRAGSLRVKEWDYYCVVCEDYALALTIADNSYMGLDSITLIDFPMRWQYTKSFIRAFPMGKTGLPTTSERGDVEVSGRRYHLRFENDGMQRALSVHVDQFFDGKPLDASITLGEAPRDSMVIATPFAGKPKAFYYNQKINCLPAYGQVVFDGTLREFPRGEAMGVLDWGRGVWTYRNTWYWGSVSGRANGTPFGLNLGYGFGDTSAASENMLFVDGKAHKLRDVQFEIPQTPEKADDFLKPWRIASKDGEIDLQFTPLLDRAAYTSALVIKSDQHQVFGAYEGRVRMEDGGWFVVPKTMGFAEKVYNCW